MTIAPDSSDDTDFIRVLEERSFRRVGGATEIGVDVRVLAATNRGAQGWRLKMVLLPAGLILLLTRCVVE